MNFLAVLISAFASIVIGMFWYSQSMFGKAWANGMGLDVTGKKGMGGSTYFLMILSSLVKAYVLAYIIGLMSEMSLSSGLQAGFWIWLGFFATTKLGDVLWSGKSWKVYFINVFHDLISLLVMGAILSVLV